MGRLLGHSVDVVLQHDLTVVEHDDRIRPSLRDHLSEGRRVSGEPVHADIDQSRSSTVLPQGAPRSLSPRDPLGRYQLAQVLKRPAVERGACQLASVTRDSAEGGKPNISGSRTMRGPYLWHVFRVRK